MNELIKVTVSEKGNQVVSARELHEFLEVKKQFTDWIKTQFERAMLVENQDYVLVTQKRVINNPKNPTTEINEYVLTLSSAKEIAMLNGGDKGKEARMYFIACERKLKEVKKEYSVKELLLMQLETIEKLEKAEHTVSILTHVNKTYVSTEIAKDLNFKSAFALNKYLHDMKIQYRQNDTWVLYSKYADCGYVQIKQEVLDNGRVIYHRRWTQLGREFLINLLNESRTVKSL